MPVKRLSLVAVVGLLLAFPALPQSTLGDCVIGPGLGSTLFFPYFEVDLADINGVTTLISINNGVSDPKLARVVLWTDWGVPTLAFDVYLVGFDVQPINLRTVLNGDIPSTGVGADLSSFPFCDTMPPFHANPVLHPDDRAQLAADHTGQPGPVFVDCAGEPYGDQIARGYITVDMVGQCSGVEGSQPRFSPANSSDPPYFVDGGGEGSIGIISNYLWGDVIFVNFSENSAQGSEAIAIWADAALFSGTEIFTFYGRHSGWDGRDDRVPLPRIWNQRFLNGGPFAGGADLIVWRDTGARSQVANCGDEPAWKPLPDSSIARDEEAGARTEIGDGTSFGLATQRVDVSSLAIPYPFGRIQISTEMGSWVQPTLKAGGIFSAAYNGAPALSTCDETPPSIRTPSPPERATRTRRDDAASRAPRGATVQ